MISEIEMLGVKTKLLVLVGQNLEYYHLTNEGKG